jgi:hypothetical protein
MNEASYACPIRCYKEGFLPLSNTISTPTASLDWDFSEM